MLLDCGDQGHPQPTIPRPIRGLSDLNPTTSTLPRIRMPLPLSCMPKARHPLVPKAPRQAPARARRHAMMLCIKMLAGHLSYQGSLTLSVPSASIFFCLRFIVFIFFPQRFLLGPKARELVGHRTPGLEHLVQQRPVHSRRINHHPVLRPELVEVAICKCVRFLIVIARRPLKAQPGTPLAQLLGQLHEQGAKRELGRH